MTNLTRDEWQLIVSALYYAAEWEKTVADSYAGIETYKEQELQAKNLAERYIALRRKLIK